MCSLTMALLVVVLAFSILPTALAQIVETACLPDETVCPKYPVCGAFRKCGEPSKVIVCQHCTPQPKNRGALTVCDFSAGRCVSNGNVTAGISGALCVPRKRTAVCGKELECRQDHTAKTRKKKYRCCRKACPRGAFGKPLFYWTNECGERHMCSIYSIY